jgi:cell division protein FtsL
MKKLLTICLLMATVLSVNAQTKTRYAFVTDTERDKSLDTKDKNGYVNLVTDVVTVNCDDSGNNIMHQLMAPL